MKPFSALTRKEKAIELLRWLCVLPAAALGDLAGKIVYGGVAALLLRDLTYEGTDRWVRHVTACLLSGIAVVVTGAKMAPRCRRTTAMVLAVIAVALATRTHWVVHGDDLPVIAEAVGVACGVVVVLCAERRNSCRDEPDACGSHPAADMREPNSDRRQTL